MSDTPFVPLEIWLAAIACAGGLFICTAITLSQLRRQRTWDHVRPQDPVQNARHAELLTSRSERLLAPLLDVVASGANQLMKPAFIDQSQDLLDKAGPRKFLTAQRLIAVRLLSAVLGLILGLILGADSSADMRLLVLVVTPCIGWFLPGVYLKRLASRRAAVVTRELPDLLDQITISVGAGLGFEAAIARVCQGSRTELASELTRTLQDIRVGVDRAAAYQGLARRVDSEDLTAVTTSLVQSIEMGTPLGPVLRARATELRRKRRSRADEQAQKLSVKLTVPTAFCILPSLMIVILGPTILKFLESGI